MPVAPVLSVIVKPLIVESESRRASARDNNIREHADHNFAIKNPAAAPIPRENRQHSWAAAGHLTQNDSALTLIN